MSETKKMASEERVAKLAARLAEAKAKLAKSDRKERSGELMALGRAVEKQFANAPDAVKTWFIRTAESHPDERVRQRALAGLERLKDKEGKNDHQEHDLRQRRANSGNADVPKNREAKDDHQCG